jgi:arylsulfatase
MSDGPPTDRSMLPAVQSLTAPDGAPNIVVILVDDMGFGTSSAFGGPCQMPTARQLATNGLRYTRFHTTAICSSTRAALLSGRNHHSVGFGWLCDFPGATSGYNARRPASAATVARILACNGYATGAFGKWHQTPVTELGPAGPFDRWPTGEGFERFYGFNGPETDQWYPALIDGTTRIASPRTPEEGYHLSEDIVDEAISWIGDTTMLHPENRFFCYLPFGATHAPLQVPRPWVEPYRGAFDEGWDVQRAVTLRHQKELGVVPHTAELAPWARGIPQWADLDDREQEAAAALMEVYAGFADHTDAQVGRLVQALQHMGILDDTLILYVLGDNGASCEGGLHGAVNELQHYGGVEVSPEDVLAQLDELGGPNTCPHYPAGWALAMNTPYPWMKQVASHFGGTRNGLIVHWPNGFGARGELRHQWHHVIDIVPTLLEAAHLPHPSVVDGTPQMPMEGAAMNGSFDDPGAEESRTTQYFEIAGARGIYHDGWIASTTHGRRPWLLHETSAPLESDVWELYDTTTDWSQAHDVADVHPEKLRHLKELFLNEAARHGVLPIDDRAMLDRFRQGWAAQSSRARTATFDGGTRAIPQFFVPFVSSRSHMVTARVVVPESGPDGVVCAQGGRFGGWALYWQNDRLTYCHNAGGACVSRVQAATPLASGPHDVCYEFQYDGGGFGRGGVATLLVDGAVVAQGRIEQTDPFGFSEGFDVGASVGSPVSPDIPGRDNAFNGDVEWVRIEVANDDENVASEMARLTEATQ